MTFSDGEFVKKCIVAAIEKLIPEKVSDCKEISLSRQTVTRRITDIGNDVFNQLQHEVKRFRYFSLAMDESNDVTDTAQLLIFVRGIDDNFNVTEELASLESMHGQTTGKDIFERVVACVENLGLNWAALCGITTDGAPNMVGQNVRLVGRINKFMKSKELEAPIAIHCIIHLHYAAKQWT